MNRVSMNVSSTVDRLPMSNQRYSPSGDFIGFKYMIFTDIIRIILLLFVVVLFGVFPGSCVKEISEIIIAQSIRQTLQPCS